MLLVSVENNITRVINSVEAFHGNGDKVRSVASFLAESYLDRAPSVDVLFPRDVAMGAILLACEKLGPAFSATGLARAANEDLVAWPQVAGDMRLQLQDVLSRI